MTTATNCRLPAPKRSAPGFPGRGFFFSVASMRALVSEMERLLEGAKKARHGTRDHLLMLMMYRHGLRVSEAIALRCDSVNLQGARLWVRRLKNGLSVEHPIAGDDPILGAIPGSCRRRECRVARDPSAHAAALVRLLSCRQGRRTIWAIATPGIPFTTRAWPGVASKGYGNSNGLWLVTGFGCRLSRTDPRAPGRRRTKPDP
jgi:integrase